MRRIITSVFFSFFAMTFSLSGCKDSSKENESSPEEVKRKKCEKLYKSYEVCSKELSDENAERALIFEGEKEFISECQKGLNSGKSTKLTEEMVGYHQLTECASENPLCSIFLECTLGELFSPSVIGGHGNLGQAVCVSKCNRKYGYFNPRMTSDNAQRCIGRCMRISGVDQ